MADSKSLTLTFIGTVLAGGILVATFNVFYNDFVREPNIMLYVKSVNSHTGKAVIEFRNVGLEPATNFIVDIQAPVDNITASEKPTGQNITLSKTSNDTIRAYIPRFVHGEGSMGQIVITGNKKGNGEITERNYTLYSTYDQGSTLGTLPPHD